MRNFANNITLSKNFRGVYDLDTSKGCLSGIKNNHKGCYNDCYAARYSYKYGYDFGNTIFRYFKNENHRKSIIKQINKIDLPFIRIGVTGDPSESWEHTLNIIESIKDCNKQIVVITKHWNLLKLYQLKKLSNYNICINTSVSALDNKLLLEHRLSQYNTLKKYCKSVLRIISCDFKSRKLNNIQNKLLENKHIIETALRISPKNEYVLDGLINLHKINFLGKRCNFSLRHKDIFIGFCDDCKEHCGINLF